MFSIITPRNRFFLQKFCPVIRVKTFFLAGKLSNILYTSQTQLELLPSPAQDVFERLFDCVARIRQAGLFSGLATSISLFGGKTTMDVG
jgi:hypothetical protein